VKQLNPNQPEKLKKRLTQAAQYLSLVGAADQTGKYVAAIFLLKIIEDLWYEKYNQLQSLIDPDDDDEEEALDALDDRVNAAYLNIPRGSFFSGIARCADEPDIAQRIDEALAGLENANPNILAGAFDGVRFSDLSEGIKRAPDFFRSFISGFSHPLFDRFPGAIGGEALLSIYRWICDEGSDTTFGAKVGELPAELGLLLAQLLEPRDGEEICDPVCADARFLLACSQMIRATNAEASNYALFGQDIQSTKQVNARVSALILGEEHLDIRPGDFFRAPAFIEDESHLKKFDVIAAQGALAVDGYGDLVARDDPYGRFHRGIAPKAKGEYVLISHIVESLKESTGRAAAIFTQGVLFREGAEAVIRERLIEENLIDAIITLPAKLVVGIPYPTAIIVFRKLRSENSILFIEASADFEAGKSQNRLLLSAIEKIVSMYKSRDSFPFISRSVRLSEVRSQNYSLQMSRYIDSSRPLSVYEAQDFTVVRKRLIQEIDIVSEEVDEILARLKS